VVVNDATFVPVIKVSSVAPSTEDLAAEVEITEQCSADLSTMKYKWSCLVGPYPEGPFEECSDDEGIFDTYVTADPFLVIPKDILVKDDLLKLTATVKSGSKETESEETETLISDNINIELSNPKTRCSIFLFANVESADLREFNWTFSSTSSNGRIKEEID